MPITTLWQRPGGMKATRETHSKNWLKRKGTTIHYAKALWYVLKLCHCVWYARYSRGGDKKIEIDFEPILLAIKNREINQVRGIKPLEEIAYRVLIKFPPKMDKNYTVSDDCVKCGICEKVCPVGNIAMNEAGGPYFKHHSSSAWPVSSLPEKSDQL